jgi:hypothetical protein
MPSQCRSPSCAFPTTQCPRGGSLRTEGRMSVLRSENLDHSIPELLKRPLLGSCARSADAACAYNSAGAGIASVSPDICGQNPGVYDLSTVHSHSEHDLQVAIFPAIRRAAFECAQRGFVGQELASGLGAELA